MNESQFTRMKDIQQPWLLGGGNGPDLQARPAHRTVSCSRVIHTHNKARLASAVLYLIATGFFGVIMAVLATSWGRGGFDHLLAEGHVARPAVIYMLVSGGFFVAASILLFSPVSLPKPLRIVLIAFAFMLMLTGIVYAAPAVVVSLVPFWFLLKFHQGVTPHIAIVPDEQKQDSPIVSAV